MRTVLVYEKKSASSPLLQKIKGGHVLGFLFHCRYDEWKLVKTFLILFTTSFALVIGYEITSTSNLCALYS